MKKVILQNNKRYRLKERKKRTIKRGEFFLDSNGKVKKSPINTAEEFYPYALDGTGRFKYWKTGSGKFTIRDYKENKHCAQVYSSEAVAKAITSFLNQANLDGELLEPSE